MICYACRRQKASPHLWHSDSRASANLGLACGFLVFVTATRASFGGPATILTIGVIIRALWNQWYRYNWQQSWPLESSSGRCEINDTYTTDNNPDHWNHHQGPVKSMIHIQLTTILTIGIIIRALWNQWYIYNWQQSWPLESSSGPCEINNYTHNWQQSWPSESSSGPCEINNYTHNWQQSWPLESSSGPCQIK